MHKLIFILCFFSLSVLQSCDSEDEQIQYITLDTKGVVLLEKQNKSSLCGDISSLENELLFVANGDNATYGYLSELTIGDDHYQFNKTEYDNPTKTKVSGEWGYLELVKSNPYTTKIVISENTSPTSRIFNLTFGRGHISSFVTITQKGIISDMPNEIEWDNIIYNQLSANEIFIGNQYLGIQDWNCIGNPPYIYTSAIFPKTSFAKSFDKEVTEGKRPITVYTDFSDPFISIINLPSGANYLDFMKDMLKSEEYRTNKQPQLHLYRISNISSVETLAKVFPNNSNLVNSLQEVIKQTMNIKNYRSLTIGELVFRGFTVTMDIPEKPGLLKNSNYNTKDMVYVRSITYGATGYFIIGSDLSYKEVRTFLSTPTIVDDSLRRLSKSTIILITNSSLGQNATLSTSFKSLNDFIMKPYSNGSYGYPIYCTGCYLDDNSFFHPDTKN